MTTPHHLPHRSAEEQSRVEAALREIFEERMNFNVLLGLKIRSCDIKAPQIEFSMDEKLVGHYHYGRLHGGVIATVLDTVAGLAVMVGVTEKFASETAEDVSHRFGRIGTIDLRTDFLHQGIGERFIATGRLTRLGGRIASVQMTLENETGLLIATGCASYVVS